MNDPGLIESAVEEVLRYDAPFQQARRRARVAVEIRGRRIPAGALVSEMIGAANRDPAQFRDPDLFDIRRPREPGIAHLAFGVGIHFCVGAALARLEAAIAIPAILGRFSDVALVDGGVAWRANTTFRGLSRLVVATGPNGSRQARSTEPDGTDRGADRPC